jgi:hypothetical protein
MDLTNYKTETTQWLTLRDPKTGEDTDTKIELYDVSSKKYQIYSAKERTAAYAMLKPITNLPDSQLENESAVETLVHAAVTQNPQLVEVYREELTELCARITKSWKNVKMPKAVPCNYENALKVYSEVQWIVEQIHVFLLDQENFTQG